MTALESVRLWLDGCPELAGTRITAGHLVGKLGSVGLTEDGTETEERLLSGRLVTRGFTLSRVCPADGDAGQNLANALWQESVVRWVNTQTALPADADGDRVFLAVTAESLAPEQYTADGRAVYSVRLTAVTREDGACAVRINGTALSAFGAERTAGAGYTSARENVLLRENGRLSLLAERSGAGTLTLPVLYYGTAEEIASHKNALERELNGVTSIEIGDGCVYSCVLSSCGAEERRGETMLLRTYVFEAVRHGAEVTEDISGEGSAVVDCTASAPRTACAVTLNCSIAAGSAVVLNINGAEFSGTASGGVSVLVADGINGTLTGDGTDLLPSWEWNILPFFSPGENSITLIADGAAVSFTGTVRYAPSCE